MAAVTRRYFMLTGKKMLAAFDEWFTACQLKEKARRSFLRSINAHQLRGFIRGNVFTVRGFMVQSGKRVDYGKGWRRYPTAPAVMIPDRRTKEGRENYKKLQSLCDPSPTELMKLVGARDFDLVDGNKVCAFCPFIIGDKKFVSGPFHSNYRLRPGMKELHEWQIRKRESMNTGRADRRKVRQ